MVSLLKFKNAVLEFRDQASIVSTSYGGSKVRWIISMFLSLVCYGARPIDYVRFEFYKKSGKERNRYLTIFRYFKMQKKFGAGFNDVSGKKNIYKTFHKFIGREWIEITKDTPFNTIESFIQRYGFVIAKPIRGEQGKGVLKISKNDKASIDELLTNCRQADYILEEMLSNERSIDAINPTSLNTVRVYTLKQRNGQTRILGIMLRVGRNGNHVDNWGSGGIGYNFDVETGICVDYGRDKQNRPYIFHPGSNIQMIGFHLPNFEELKLYVERLSQVCPQARFVGWDIAITPSGFALVEMNCPGGHDFLQAFGEPFGDVLKKELL